MTKSTARAGSRQAEGRREVDKVHFPMVNGINTPTMSETTMGTFLSALTRPKRRITRMARSMRMVFRLRNEAPSETTEDATTTISKIFHPAGHSEVVRNANAKLSKGGYHCTQKDETSEQRRSGEDPQRKEA